MLDVTANRSDTQALAEEQRADLRQYLGIVKKRKFYLIIPALLTLIAGVVAAFVLPPTFLSEGKILVETQQIPTDLVRPTVTGTARERIQVIQQRVMTRENLLAIADKYRVYAGQAELSRTDILDLMRENVVVVPIELDRANRNQNQTIAVRVGFMHRQSDMATRVANELVTLFLNEDARNRTNRAMETTRFLSREVQRLEGELRAADAKLTEANSKKAPGIEGIGQQQPSAVTQLRVELAAKSAIYRSTHPEVKKLKAQLEALEKADLPAAASRPVQTASGLPMSREMMDEMHLQRMSIQKNLEAANSRLAAARLGETLERDQFSERLEVLEQAVPPQAPLKPNRLKIIAFSFMAAMAAGVGGVFAVEAFDRTIRGKRDLTRLIDGQLLISIPYISTRAELRRTRSRWLISAAVIVLIIIVALLSVHLLWRPLDELWTILQTRLMQGVRIR